MAAQTSTFHEHRPHESEVGLRAYQFDGRDFLFTMRESLQCVLLPFIRGIFRPERFEARNVRL